MGFFSELMGIPPRTVEAVETEPERRANLASVQTRTLEQITDAIISGQTLPEIRALPAVTGARRLIASTIDQLGITVDRGDVPRWLENPRYEGSVLDRGDIVQHTVDAMLLHGRAFWFVELSSSDPYAPVWIVSPLDPGIVDVRTTRHGWPGREFIVSGVAKPVPEVPARGAALGGKGSEYLLHIPYVVTVDHPEGTTPLRESERMLRGLLDTELHTADLFASGTHVGGILSTEFDITTEQAKAWQDVWIVARQTGRIPVLGNGLAYRNDFPNARDLQMVEARSFNQSVVWALLGIPMAYMGSSLMGGQSSLSYANAQDNRRQFADNCLRAFTTQIEDAVSRLLPLGQQARFDYTEWEGRADDGAQNAATVSVPSA